MCVAIVTMYANRYWVTYIQRYDPIPTYIWTGLSLKNTIVPICSKRSRHAVVARFIIFHTYIHFSHKVTLLSAFRVRLSFIYP